MKDARRDISVINSCILFATAGNTTALWSFIRPLYSGLYKTSSMAWGTTTGRSVNTTEMEWRVGYLRRNQPLTGRGPFHRTPWIRPTSTLVVNVNLVRWNQTSDPSCSCGQIHPVPVARLYRLCYILWTIVQIWNSPAVCEPCIWLRRRLSPGSACRAHAKKKCLRWLAGIMVGHPTYDQEVVGSTSSWSLSNGYYFDGWLSALPHFVEIKNIIAKDF